MVVRILMAFALMAACVVLHAAGLTAAMKWLEKSLSGLGRNYWRQIRLLIVVACWTVMVHLVEITVWGLYYVVGGALPDLASSFYFSAVTYTTTGYGDLVLPEEWRLVGGVEALTGILMCGLSTGFFFAALSKAFEAGSQPEPD